MSKTERVINDLNVAKHILCNPQMLTPEMRIRIGQAIDSAINLLTEQEPRIMTLLEIEQSENCLVWFEDDRFNNYALVDGIDRGNGWVWLSHMGLQQRRDYENYGKRWRCWTKRPEEDQRKAVKLGEFR